VNTYSHAIILLAAGIKQNQSGKWVSTDLSEEDDKLGAPGGKLRILAAAILVKENLNTFIITGGGKGKDIAEGTSNKRPLLAEILRDELIAEGVPLNLIQLEWVSGSTYQELVEVERMTKELGVTKLTFVINRYSLPRVQLMIEDKFAHFNSQYVFDFVAAEDVLIKTFPQVWEKKIKKEYSSEYLKRRIAREQQGIEQIRKGVYEYGNRLTHIDLEITTNTSFCARLVTPKDEELLLIWANDPVTRSNAFSPAKISKETHHKWFHAILSHLEECRLYIIETPDAIAIGQVRFDCKEENWEVDYSLTPLYRGRGLGRLLLETAIKKLCTEIPGVRIFGQVKLGNLSSRRIFESLGFEAEYDKGRAVMIYRGVF